MVSRHEGPLPIRADLLEEGVVSRQFLFSYLTDEEFLHHLLTKADPTEEDLEAAHRMEMLMETYQKTLQMLHDLAVQADGGSQSAMERLKEFTAPITKMMRVQ